MGGSSRYDSAQKGRASRSIATGSAAAATYEYDPANRRISQTNYTGSSATANLAAGTTEFYFYGITGQKLGTYNFVPPGFGVQGGPALVWSAVSTQVFFKGKLISRSGSGVGAVQEDVRGSVGSYYPYGEDRAPGAANDAVKFATYTRDSVSGLDYARNRYHLGGSGRFSTPDPFRELGNGGASARRPASWNRYSYVEGDPVDQNDRLGLYLSANGLGSGGDEDDDEDGDPEQGPQSTPNKPMAPKPFMPGRSTARGVLFSSPACAKALGAATPAAAASALDNASYSYAQLGGYTFTPWPGPLATDQPNYGAFQPPTFAYANGNSIILNSQIDWLNPNITSSKNTLTGAVTVVPVLSQMMDLFGLTSLNATQFQAAVILHELGHLLGGLPDDVDANGKPIVDPATRVYVSVENQQKVFDNCFSGLKQ